MSKRRGWDFEMTNQQLRPFVSVCVITYNQAGLIKKTLDSILAQKTDFEYELIIANDCSPDNTDAIVQEYIHAHPVGKRIKYFKQEKNLGVTPNFIFALQQCAGKYVALCEGDDYWIDPLKLQKQADFMESHPDFSMCFADVEVLDEIGTAMPDKYPRHDSDVYTFEDIILSPRCIMPTATLLFRNILPQPPPSFLYSALSGDIATQLLLTDKGKAKHFPEKMAAWRNHSGGITKTQHHIDNGDAALRRLFIDINKYFNYKYDRVISRRLLEMSKVSLIYGSRNCKGIEKAKHYLRNFPIYMGYSFKCGINIKEIIYYHMVLFFPQALKLYKKKP